jgi:hypothetical protein
MISMFHDFSDWLAGQALARPIAEVPSTFSSKA